MAVVRSIAELEKAIMRDMENAMKSVEAYALADLYEATGKFYGGGEPKMYVRTGALANTPMTTKPARSGHIISFEAKLNDSGGYSTGKSPSMGAVLKLTNDGKYPGLRPAVGTTHYWQDAEMNIEEDLNKVFSRAFN